MSVMYFGESLFVTTNRLGCMKIVIIPFGFLYDFGRNCYTMWTTDVWIDPLSKGWMYGIWRSCAL